MTTSTPQRFDLGWARRIATFLLPYRMRILLAAAAMAGDAILTAFRPWPLKVIVDNVILGHATRVPLFGPWINAPGRDRAYVLYAACGATLVIAAGTGLLSYAFTRILGEVGQRFSVDLRRHTFGHLQRLSLRFHDSHRLGDLLSRITSDISALRLLVARVSITFVSSSFLLIAMLALMFWLSWRFALVAIAVAPVLFWVVWAHTRHIKVSTRTARESDGVLASLAHETFSSIRIVQGMGQERAVDERFQGQSEESLRAHLRTVRFQARMAPLVDVLAAFGTALVMWYGATRVLSGEMTTGDVIVFFSYVTGFYSPMRAISRQSFAITTAVVGGERIGQLLSVGSEVVSRPGAIEPGRLKGQIAFMDVGFAYQPDSPVLSGINLRIEAGECVAIVGTTGAGKSTLASLILRLYDPTSGRVCIDGRDIRDYQVDSLRERIGVVLQDAMLFSGTIAENIAFGAPDATMAEIVEAARIANADEFIRRMPRAYESEVAEDGSTLSGGQRQRIAIARAVVRRAPILVLDEPTSDLDLDSERAVLGALAAAAAGRTTILITHRLTATRMASRVVVIDAGRVVEDGPRDSLLQRGGRFSQLWSLSGHE